MRKIVILKHPIHLPKTYYRAIGEVITRTALFEYHLMDAIAVILKISEPKQKRIVLMSMSIKPKLGILKSLTSHWVTGKLQNEFFSIISEAGPLINFRHDLAHGVWGYETDPRKLQLIFLDEPKDVYLPKSAPLKSREIERVAKVILGIDKRLIKATKSLEISLAP